MLGIDIPETENHLLMIESTRYFANQLEFKRTGDRKFNNNANRLTGWLLDFIANIARFDFLEFNARPDTRPSVYVLLNLYEFAEDEALRLAAQHVLDYLMVKFAVSSNRYRRVLPFRRLQETTNFAEGEWNDLMSPQGDLLTGFFLVYCSPIDDHRLRDDFPGPGEGQLSSLPHPRTDRRRRPIASRWNAARRRSIVSSTASVRACPCRPMMPTAVSRSISARRPFCCPPAACSSTAATGETRRHAWVVAECQRADRARAGADAAPDARQPLVRGGDPLRSLPRSDHAGRIPTTRSGKGGHNRSASAALPAAPTCASLSAGSTLRAQQWMALWTFLDLNRDGGKLGFYVATYHAAVTDLIDVILADDFNPQYG